MKSLKRVSGFTLIEILVVIAIIGILLAAIVPNIVGRSDQARVVKAKQDIVTLEGALDAYKLDNAFYPSTQQGLQALVAAPSTEPLPKHYKTGGYIKRLPTDPWGNEYQYLNPGVHGEIDIFSYGADGVEGGDGLNADIGNWQ